MYARFWKQQRTMMCTNLVKVGITKHPMSCLITFSFDYYSELDDDPSIAMVNGSKEFKG